MREEWSFPRQVKIKKKNYFHFKTKKTQLASSTAKNEMRILLGKTLKDHQDSNKLIMEYRKEKLRSIKTVFMCCKSIYTTKKTYCC